MKSEHCQVLVIGAGPGGYVCGIRAGQLGLGTIVLEEAAPGGTCLNIGCIPSKALIHATDAFYKTRLFSQANPLGISTTAPVIDMVQTQAWKDGIVARLTHGVAGLLKKSKTRLIQGRARILDGKTVEVETSGDPVRITCDNLVLATGSRPVELGILPFGQKIVSSTEALAFDAVPTSLAVVGGGYIGLEIGTAMAKLGSAVTVIEAAERVLPQYDAALTTPVEARLRALGVALKLGAEAKGLDDDGALRITRNGADEGVPCEKVLVTVGRAPNLSGFGLETLGLDRAGRFIAVDDRCRTSMRGTFAIGDITGEPMLAHRAMAQGVIVAEHIAGLPSRWDKRAVPAVCFTDPELVVVGALPSETTATAVFPFAANGRAMTMERDDGFVRVVYAPETGLVTGLQAVGSGVSELAGEFALAIEMCATLRDISDTIHAHPTLGEATQEVGHLAMGHALHI